MTPTAHPALDPTSVGPSSGRTLPVLTAGLRVGLDPALLDVMEYRKSELSLNWIVGCPRDCGYCVRVARRDPRRAERVGRLTVADHIAHWRAQHRPRKAPGWWLR